MENPLLDRMYRRQRARRLDTLQRYGMIMFITTVVAYSVLEFFRSV